MTPVNDTFSVPEGGATAVASLTVDDWGKLTISGPGGTFELDLTPDADEPGELGGHQEWTKSGSFELSEGTYALSITHQNIDMPHNEYNQSVCRYSVTVTAHGSSGGSSSSSSSSSSDMPPEEKEICCRCGTCTDAEGNEYTIAAEKLPGDPGVEICMSQAEFLAGGGAPSPAAFSLRTAENARETAEACGSLKYVSPWAWRAHLDETSGLITVVPPAVPRFTSTCRPVPMRPSPRASPASATSGCSCWMKLWLLPLPVPPPTFPWWTRTGRKSASPRKPAPWSA